jgi:release factor glutamine methyltransferase
MTLREALTAASTTIARRDAETLALHILERDRAWLFTHHDTELAPAQLERLNQLIARRASHEPLQHLTGTQEFYGLPLRVTRDTLIPRPETELLVEAAIAWANSQPPANPIRILDVGTGTGAIALALATHLPTAEITAIDISPAALTIARENAAALNLTDRITFVESDLLAALTTSLPFDLIASNPPYIPTTDAPTLAAEVHDHEPHTALFAGNDGLDIYRRLIPAAHAALRPNGLLALEFGFGQRDALRFLLEDPTHLWHDLRFLNDYAQIPRIALALRT